MKLIFSLVVYHLIFSHSSIVHVQTTPTLYKCKQESEHPRHLIKNKDNYIYHFINSLPILSDGGDMSQDIETALNKYDYLQQEQANMPNRYTYSDQVFWDYMHERQHLSRTLIDELTFGSIDNLLSWWKKNKFREQIDIYFKTHDPSMREQKEMLIIEWGGGDISYRALYIPIKDMGYFYFIHFLHHQLHFEKLPIQSTMHSDFKTVCTYLQEAHIGDISRFGLGIPTYLLSYINKENEGFFGIIHGGLDDLNKRLALEEDAWISKIAKLITEFQHQFPTIINKGI